MLIYRSGGEAVMWRSDIPGPAVSSWLCSGLHITCDLFVSYKPSSLQCSPCSWQDQESLLYPSVSTWCFSSTLSYSLSYFFLIYSEKKSVYKETDRSLGASKQARCSWAFFVSQPLFSCVPKLLILILMLYFYQQTHCFWQRTCSAPLKEILSVVVWYCQLLSPHFVQWHLADNSISQWKQNFSPYSYQT